MPMTVLKPRGEGRQALGAAAVDDIAIPTWVPPEFRAGYRKVAAERGEEEAASWARRMKNGKPEALPAVPHVRKSYGSAATSTQRASAKAGFAWTQALEDDVRRLHQEGWSAGAIAAEIGAPTRNVVIGKIARLGLKRDLAQKPVVEPKPASTRAPVKVAKVVPAAEMALEPVEPKPATTAGEAAPLGAITIHELRDHRCHWPFGDPREEGFRYCGAPVAAVTRERGRFYCDGHMAAASVPVKGRGR